MNEIFCDYPGKICSYRQVQFSLSFRELVVCLFMKDHEVIGLYFRNKIFDLKFTTEIYYFFKEAIFKSSYYSEKKKRALRNQNQ